jgi:hypothetical protein
MKYFILLLLLLIPTVLAQTEIQKQALQEIEDKFNEEFQASLVCGNGVCQEGENFWSCQQDCAQTDKEVLCPPGKEDCKSWMFSNGIWILLASIIFFQIRKQRRNKR